MPRYTTASTTDEFVRTAPPGKHPAGVNLMLLVRGPDTAFWIFRYSIDKKAREKSLGPARGPNAVSRQNADELAEMYRGLLRRGIDPRNMPDLRQPGVRRSWKLARLVNVIGGSTPPKEMADGLDRAAIALTAARSVSVGGHLRRDEKLPTRSERREHLTKLRDQMTATVEALDDPALLRLTVDDRDGEDAIRQVRFGLLSLIERVAPAIEAIPEGPGRKQHGTVADPHEVCAALIVGAWRLWRGEVPHGALREACESCVLLWEVASGQDAAVNTNTLRQWRAPLRAAMAEVESAPFCGLAGLAREILIRHGGPPIRREP